MARTITGQRRREIVIAQTRHLREIAHGGFAAIACQLVFVVNEAASKGQGPAHVGESSVD